MNRGVIRGPVAPAGVHDAEPGPAEDADGLGVAFASISGAFVEVGGPRIVVSAVIGEVAECLARLEWRRAGRRQRELCRWRG